MSQHWSPSLISIRAAAQEESRATSRYYYDGLTRGGGASFVILQQTLKGEGKFSMNGTTWTVGPGEAFISVVPEESAYFYPPEARRPWVFCWMNMYGDFAVRLFKDLQSGRGPVIKIPLDGAASREFHSLIRKVERRQLVDRYETSQSAYHFYATLCQELDRPATSRISLEEAVGYCRKNFHEPLRIKEIAGMTGLSREHFTRLFLERYSVSPGYFLRELRLKHARAMIEQTGAPLSEIALRTGFSSGKQLGIALRRSRNR
jgi:AraC-like DNA-binding protein